MKALAPLASLAFLAPALLLAAPSARADEPPPPKETRFFESYDKDLDGRVTLEEFQSGGGESAAFALLDGNQDGAVCPDELGLPADYKPLPVERRPKGPEGAQPGGKGGMPGGKGGDGARGAELRKKFQEMDADGDGKVSQAEWKGPPEGFARLDRNADGVLDAADMQGKGGAGGGMGLELVRRRWAEMDADGDGKLTPAEWKGDQPFERVDADKDGVLTEADLKAMMSAFGGGGPGAPGASEGGPKELTPEQVAQHFAGLDKDASGKLEAAELPEQNRERMLKADSDGDGALSPAEFAEGHRKSQRAGKPGKGGPGAGPGGPGGPGGGPELLRRFDHDRDGKVTREQFPGSDQKFAELDKNGDGVLTTDDFPAPPPPAPGSPAQGAPAGPGLIGRLDKDGDGRLSRAEFQGSDDDWRRLDANTDGWISTDEAAPR